MPSLPALVPIIRVGHLCQLAFGIWQIAEPIADRSTDELAAVVGPDRFREASVQTDYFEYLPDLQTGYRRIDLARQIFSRVFVDQGQHLEFAARHRLVKHKVIRPYLIGGQCLRHYPDKRT